MDAAMRVHAPFWDDHDHAEPPEGGPDPLWQAAKLCALLAGMILAAVLVVAWGTA